MFGSMALVNYISALSPFDGDGELYKKYWPADLPFSGEGNRTFPYNYFGL